LRVPGVAMALLASDRSGTLGAARADPPIPKTATYCSHTVTIIPAAEIRVS
jgi:hypothetical protein